MRLFAARKKRARPRRPGSAIRTLPASELVAQSGAGDIDRGPDIAIVKEEDSVVEKEVVVGVRDPPEVVVQPFASKEPIIEKLPFESDTCHPAELVEFRSFGRLENRNPRGKQPGRTNTLMAPANASGAVEE